MSPGLSVPRLHQHGGDRTAAAVELPSITVPSAGRCGLALSSRISACKPMVSSRRSRLSFLVADDFVDHRSTSPTSRAWSGAHGCCSVRTRSGWRRACRSGRRCRRPRSSIWSACSRPSACRPKSSSSKPIRSDQPKHRDRGEARPRPRSVATVLVQRGTLKPGDIVVAGAEWGRVRALVSDTGHSGDRGRPSTPVEVLGFNGTPEAGDRLASSTTRHAPRGHGLPRPSRSAKKSSARASGVRGSSSKMMAQVKTRGRKTR